MKNKIRTWVFRILWVLDAIVLFVFAWFFFIGLGDGTVDGANIWLWLPLLAAMASILYGSYWLKTHERPGLAYILLGILAIPAFIYLFVMLILITGNGNWK